jgi:hypothetical protein
MKAWLRNAFAIGPRESAAVTAEQQALIDRLCREVVRRGLATPAIAFLEMSHPLNAVGAATLHFFTPIISVVFDVDGCRRFAEFLEQRGSIEILCRRIEELQREGRSPAAPR